MKNLWPSEQHQWGLCPVVWRFSWGNLQCAVFKDQGQWNSIEILFPFIRRGILRPYIRLFSESYWEGTTFCTLLILKISPTTESAGIVPDTLDPTLVEQNQSQPLIPDNASNLTSLLQRYLTLPGWIKSDTVDCPPTALCFSFFFTYYSQCRFVF